jgi:hypothetical protein
MATPSDVLVPEPPPPFVLPVLRTQGDVPSTSAPVPGVRRVIFQSNARERAENARASRNQVLRGVVRNLDDSDRVASKKTETEDVAWSGSAW